MDAITLLNHLGISISYDIHIQKLKGIAAESYQWTKQQPSNSMLIGTWDNFEYRENVHGERVGDKVKFRSITMTLWVKNSWQIPEQGLKQLMWNPKAASLDTVLVFLNVLGDKAKFVRNKCIQHHRLTAFQGDFPDITIQYSCIMPVINVINCKTEGPTVGYAFAPSMHSESTTAGNIAVFEDLAIRQMGLTKDDSRWGDLLTLWWGDLKTEVQMLGIQSNGIGSKRPFKSYQHIMPGLALWHLRFNYFKKIWEVFYPGGSATERSTLQWAADHWYRDKTTRPSNFHSLEDLTMHSYRAQIIAMLKSWIQDQEQTIKLFDSESLGS